ncbi:MAG: hypothetical protein IKV48_02515 [Eggerthellaceae bacterium]|nr:hypothetical protein [Eggerthellaceae bacterium]
MDRYFGSYQRFDTVADKDAGYLLNADNLVGDSFEIDIVFEDKTRVAWLVNKFGKRIGFFDEDFSRQLALMEAKGWVLNAYLSYVAYTEEAEGGKYWGEMAVVCYEKQIEAQVATFTKWLSSKLQDSVRPRIDFDNGAVDKLVSSKGTWQPEQTLPILKPEKGTVIMKDSLSLGDKIIEQGRKGNIGCYAISWGFIIAIVALVLFAIAGILFL